MAAPEQPQPPPPHTPLRLTRQQLHTACSRGSSRTAATHTEAVDTACSRAHTLNPKPYIEAVAQWYALGIGGRLCGVAPAAGAKQGLQHSE